MTVQLLIAPPAAGKTQACIQMLRAAPGENWVLVRDRLQAAYFRRRLAEAGGVLGTRVETFRDLYREVLEANGQPRRPLAGPGLQRQVMQRVLQTVELGAYAPLRDLPGFAAAMLERVGELRRGRARLTDLPENYADLARIAAAYDDLYAQLGWNDTEGLMSAGLELLAGQAATPFDSLSLLIVDGFDTFDSSQRAALRLLAGRVDRMLITLPGEPGWTRPVHRRFRREFADLQDDLQAEVIASEKTHILPGELAYLEASLYQPEPGLRPADALARVELLEARSPADEAREALRWLKRKVVREELPLRRCALLLAEPASYELHLRAAAAEFGMSLRFAYGRRLSDSVLAGAAIQLLGLPLSGYPRRGVLDALRSPFFNLAELGLDRRDLDVLELLSRSAKVIEGLEQWEEAFGVQVALPLDDDENAPVESEDEGLSVPRLPRGIEAAALRDRFRRFAECIRPPEGRSLQGWVRWLEDVLEQLGFYPAAEQALDAETHAVLECWRDMLQSLLTAEEALSSLGASPVDYSVFYQQLVASLNGAAYTVENPPWVDQVLVLPLSDARGIRFAAAAVLGLAEGAFPRVLRPDPLLDENTRARLGLQPRLEQDQLGLFYLAATRADDALLFTRPYLSASGDPWEPSPYWAALEVLFPGRVKRIRPEDPHPLCEAASTGEVLFWAARRGMELPPEYGEALNERWQRVIQSAEQLGCLLDGSGDQQAADQDLIDWAREHFDPATPLSASRLEAMTACPFRFFLENGLMVESHDPPEWDLAPDQLGHILHAILEEVYAGAHDPADVNEVLRRLPHVAGRIFAEAPAEHGFRPSPLWESQQAELLERLHDTIVGLAENEGGWRPLAFEQRFGFKGQRPLVIETEAGTIRLLGVIDRIDTNGAGELRVVDYKTGSSHLALGDLKKGYKLQLPLYALAVRDALNLGEPVEGFYWRIGKDGAKNSVKLGKDGVGVNIARAVEHAGRAYSRLRTADFRLEPLEGKCSPYCAGSAWCWRFINERSD